MTSNRSASSCCVIPFSLRREYRKFPNAFNVPPPESEYGHCTPLQPSCQIPAVELCRIAVESLRISEDALSSRATRQNFYGIFVHTSNPLDIFPPFCYNFPMPLQQDQRTQTSKNIREYGETGRRKGLKIPRERSRIGSNPITRTRKMREIIRKLSHFCC